MPFFSVNPIKSHTIVSPVLTPYQQVGTLTVENVLLCRFTCELISGSEAITHFLSATSSDVTMTLTVKVYNVTAVVLFNINLHYLHHNTTNNTTEETSEDNKFKKS